MDKASGLEERVFVGRSPVKSTLDVHSLAAKIAGVLCEFAADAVSQEREELRKNNHILIVAKRHVLPGAKLVECYQTQTEYVVLGDVEDGDEHSCDEMGCGTFTHVIARWPRKRAEPAGGPGEG